MSYLGNYCKYVSNSEANESYHIWTAMIALSTIVSRKVYINQGMFSIYPNLYVVLVGPPGNRKTTAMSVGKRLIRQVCGPKAFSAEATTRESLIRAMAENVCTYVVDPSKPPVVYTPITICVTELSEFLGAGGAGMINFLTTIYDQDFYDYKTKNKGHDQIVNPYFTLLGCTTPAWITARLRDDVISGGFSRRAIFVYEYERGKRIAFPDISTEQEKAWDDLLAYCEVLKEVKGEFVWTPDAREFYNDWYTKLVIPDDPNISGYYESKHVQLLKVSMLLQLSESTELVLTTDILQKGLAFLDQTEKNLSKVFEGMGRNELNAIAAKVMDLLQKVRSIPYRKLESIFYKDVTSEEFYKVVYYLKSSGRVLDTNTPNGERILSIPPQSPVRESSPDEQAPPPSLPS